MLAIHVIIHDDQRRVSRNAVQVIMDNRQVEAFRQQLLQGQAMSKEQGRRRALELQKISAALRRIEAGDYGYCHDCDEPIAIQRLMLDPAATLCIRCASARERQR